MCAYMGTRSDEVECRGAVIASAILAAMCTLILTIEVDISLVQIFTTKGMRPVESSA